VVGMSGVRSGVRAGLVFVPVYGVTGG
jgi:hypothetical protein